MRYPLEVQSAQKYHPRSAFRAHTLSKAKIRRMRDVENMNPSSVTFSELRRLGKHINAQRTTSNPFKLIDDATFTLRVVGYGGLRVVAKRVLSDYKCEDEGKILDLLVQWPNLIQILHDGVRIINSFFNDADLSLKVQHDPDLACQPSLLLLITTSLESREARPIYQQLYDDWWRGAFKLSGKRLNIVLAYK